MIQTEDTFARQLCTKKQKQIPCRFLKSTGQCCQKQSLFTRICENDQKR